MKQMKLKVKFFGSLILMSIISGCNINYSESGKSINIKSDSLELSLAKKSLRFIYENKIDSLNELLNKDILKKSNPEQLEWLFTNGQRVMENNKYPNDSIITINTTTRKSISGEEVFKEFNFPFINDMNPDSTMYFKITIANREIYKLMLSTGMMIKKIE